ncbi:Mg2+ transporter protein, Zinc transport protein [Parasponia andersonii]|uniref:Mg2+ transporter protein, Zinc transport protein n=1 Tax=Parasponia andersonii TaxID=3476 RepID=A0A2P5AYV7_PARAD|nr:Mg2+ transporter protein, Zinc transport protein [Parasponia andersonii]
MKRLENHRNYPSGDAVPGNDLWTDGLICAFEFIRGQKKSINSKSGSRIPSRQRISGEQSRLHVPSNGFAETSFSKLDRNRVVETASLTELRSNSTASDDEKGGQVHQPGQIHSFERYEGSYWVPIGWARISELVQTVQVDAGWASQLLDSMDDEEDFTVADLAAPYWERPAGPIWWCHVSAGHPSIDSWLGNAQWLHPAISLALRDESRLISDKMKHLLYEVPVRVAGGLLFELLGQSAGDPWVDEDDIPVVLRSWQAQNFLVTVLHLKGPVSNINVLGITEVQELLSAGGYNAPRTVHEIIAHLASRLTRWDDRLFRKSIFGAADEIELKFMNRRNHEDMNLFSVILNQEIRKLSRQVIRVKWSLHAREEIVFELLQHLRGIAARSLLEGIRKSTREMIEEQEAVRGRLFTIQDVMQSTVRAWLQDRSLRVTHNLAVFGGCGLVLSIITGLFGINVDGIPGAENTPYAFGLFTVVLLCLGVILIAVGLVYLGLKRPIAEEQVEVRKLELQELVKMFQHEAETHAQVRKNVSRNNLPPTAGDLFSNDADYVLIQ